MQLNKLEIARIQDKAEAEAERSKLGVARILDKAQAEVERNKLEVAVIQDKARLHESFVQIVATKDYERLKAILNEREGKQRLQDKAQAEAERSKPEVARVQDKAHFCIGAVIA